MCSGGGAALTDEEKRAACGGAMEAIAAYSTILLSGSSMIPRAPAA